MAFKIIGMALLLASLSHQALANPAIKQALDHYQGQGAGPFSAEQGEKLWPSEHPSSKGGASRNCGLCHGQDLTQTGKHARTGKTIKAMAPSRMAAINSCIRSLPGLALVT